MIPMLCEEVKKLGARGSDFTCNSLLHVVYMLLSKVDMFRRQTLRVLYTKTNIFKFILPSKQKLELNSTKE